MIPQNHPLDSLKTQNVFKSRCAISANPTKPTGAAVTTEHLSKLCAHVEDRFREIIEAQIAEYWRQTRQGSAERALRELKIEEAEHERLGRERGGEASFVGRRSELKAILDYVQGGSAWPLVIHGASGCGKTALLARAAQEVGRTRRPIVRFAGASPQSSNLRALLSTLCQELRLRHPREDELPADAKKLSEELHAQLQLATPEQPLILFLDALDQLADADDGFFLHWLPGGQLPPYVKIVVSCLSDRAASDPAGQPYAELRRRQIPAGNFINLNSFSAEEAIILLFQRWLPLARRSLSREQCRRVAERLASPRCRQPIYLKLLFEEVRLWHSYEQMPELGEDVPNLLGQLFARLAQPTNHGPLLVGLVLGYLAASRHGLAESEILEILFADPDYNASLARASAKSLHELPPEATRIPIAIWSRLRFDLATYLTERAAIGANVLTFYHRQVAEWVHERIAKAADNTWRPHQRLAEYFVRSAKGNDPEHEWETNGVRGFAECIFHLSKAGQFEQSAALLSDFPFLLHKLRVGLLEGVFDDYEIVRRAKPSDLAKRLTIWTDFFRENAHLLRHGNDSWPAHKILLQLATEHADDSPVTAAAEQWLAQDRCNWLWLRAALRRAHVPATSGQVVLEGHTKDIAEVMLTGDGRLISRSQDLSVRVWDYRAGKCLAELTGHTALIGGMCLLPDDRLLTWADDKTLRLWDTRSGSCLAVLSGHTDRVYGACILSDSRIISWSEDKTLRIWSAEGRACLQILEGHVGPVLGGRLISNAHFLSCSSDGTLRQWDLSSGRCEFILDGNDGSVCGIASFRNGLLLAWSTTNTIRIWDLNRRTCRAVLSGHQDPVNGATLLPSGLVASWSGEEIRVAANNNDNTIRLWDPETGVCVAVLHGHTEAVRGARLLADGRMLSWSGDGTLKIWNLETAECALTLEGHDNRIWSACQLRDGRILSWSLDSTLRLWDAETGQCVVVLAGHTHFVLGAVELPDGNLVSYGTDGALRFWDLARASTSSENLPNFSGAALATLPLSEEYFLSFGQTLIIAWNADKGVPVAVLEGHGYDEVGYCGIWQHLLLHDRRLLTWSWDRTMRIWAIGARECIAQLPIGDAFVRKILQLGNRRIVACSDDAIRIFDPIDYKCLFTLPPGAGGAIPLTSGRFAAWSTGLTKNSDASIRICDAQDGRCIKTLSGQVNGAAAFDGQRILSWANDGSLRVWDIAKGEISLTLAGHTASVKGARILTENQLLSWSEDGIYKLWSTLDGTCLSTAKEDGILQLHPDWLAARQRAENPNRCSTEFLLLDSEGAARLIYPPAGSTTAVWHSNSIVQAHILLADGTAVVITENGHVWALKLHYGSSRVSLKTAGQLLDSAKDGAISIRQVDLANAIVKTAAAAPALQSSDFLARVRNALQEGDPQRALDILRREGDGNKACQDMIGVSQLRLGQAEAARDTFARLLFPKGDVTISDGESPRRIANYATTQLLCGDIRAARRTLNLFWDQRDRSISRLQAAIAAWERSLSVGERLKWNFGGSVDKPMTLDFPPGEY